jgi:hypothetical protein
LAATKTRRKTQFAITAIRIKNKRVSSPLSKAQFTSWAFLGSC